MQSCHTFRAAVDAESNRERSSKTVDILIIACRLCISIVYLHADADTNADVIIVAGGIFNA